MRKRWFTVLLTILTGCSSASFTVVNDAAPDREIESLTQSLDAGDSASTVDATSPICDLYSCKPGCSCEEGTKCGIGGSLSCGSMNCNFYGVDAESYNCPSELTAIYKCTHYYADANTPDRLPRCQFRSGSTAEGDFTYWCCPKN